MSSLKKTRAIDMTTGPELKSIVLFALPLMLGQLLQQLYSTVDGIVVGNFVSASALAAVGNCSTMAFLFIAISTGMSNGSGIVISQAFGAGQEDKMRSAAASILLLMFAFSLLFTVAGVGFPEFFTKTILAIEEDALRQQATVYFRIYCVGLIASCLYTAVAGILRAVGDSRALLGFLMVSTVLNTVLDILFVVGFHWGVAGAAWATVIAQVACLVVSLIYMYRRYPIFRFSSLREFKPNGAMLKLCLRMGIPSTIQQLIISSGHLFFQRLVNSFGEATIAAVTVGSRFDHYGSVPVLSMSQAMASYTGQNVGAGRYDRVVRGTRRAAFFDFGVVTVLCAILYTFAAALASLFGVEGETLEIAVRYLRALSLSLPIFAFYIPYNATLQGAGAPLSSVAVSFVALFVRVFLAYLLVYAFDFGREACWNTYWISWILAGAVALIIYRRGKWKTKRLVRTNEEATE